jgi:hypothetical protein
MGSGSEILTIRDHSDDVKSANIDNFVHQPGLHCGSTALRDAACFIGLPWSEAMVFGLASGIGFFLVEADSANPSRMFHGRSGLFENDFEETTGLQLIQDMTRDSDEAWTGIRAYLDGGEPVLIKSDIRYLPYYNTDVEFNGHKVVVAGYDLQNDRIRIADTAFEGLQDIGLHDLKKTLASDGAPLFWSECVYGPLRRTQNERPLADAIPRAIRLTAHRMLEDLSGFGGQTALEKFADRVSGYQTRADANWIARFGYQVIEKRGTGGGMFRKLYAEFLREAQEHIEIDREISAEMSDIASHWSQLAAALRRASEGEKDAWDASGDIAKTLAKKERSFHEATREFGKVSKENIKQDSK